MTSHAGSSLGCQLQSRTVSNGKQRTLTSTCSRVLYNEMKQNSHWYFPSPENPKEKDHKFLFDFLFWFIIWDVYLIYKVSSIWSNSNLPIPPPNFHFLSKKKKLFSIKKHSLPFKSFILIRHACARESKKYEKARYETNLLGNRCRWSEDIVTSQSP